MGLPTYFSNASGFLGPERNWAPAAAVLGAVWGIPPGALIGFLVAKFQTNKLIGAIVGSAVGISLAVGLLVWGVDPLIDWDIFNVGLVSVPICALIGLIVAATNKQDPIS